MTTDRLDSSLRALDPARDITPRRDADVVLERIYAAGPERADARRPRLRRPLAAGVAAAAAAAAVVASVGLHGSDSAYATWTHTPRAVDAVRDHETAKQCHAWISEDSPNRIPSTPVLTEARGDWVLALLTTSQGPVTCLNDVSAKGEPSGGTDGPLSLPAAVPAHGVALTWAGGTAHSGAPIVRTLVGKAADDVTSVTVHTTAQGDVRATLLEGWVVVWWPGEDEGHEILDPDGRLSAGYDNVRITRRDGSTQTLSADAVTTP